MQQPFSNYIKNDYPLIEVLFDEKKSICNNTFVHSFIYKLFIRKLNEFIRLEGNLTSIYDIDKINILLIGKERKGKYQRTARGMVVLETLVDYKVRLVRPYSFVKFAENIIVTNVLFYFYIM